jgi:hypothetical protein
VLVLADGPDLVVLGVAHVADLLPHVPPRLADPLARPLALLAGRDQLRHPHVGACLRRLVASSFGVPRERRLLVVVLLGGLLLCVVADAGCAPRARRPAGLGGRLLRGEKNTLRFSFVFLVALPFFFFFFFSLDLGKARGRRVVLLEEDAAAFLKACEGGGGVDRRRRRGLGSSLSFHLFVRVKLVVVVLEVLLGVAGVSEVQDGGRPALPVLEEHEPRRRPADPPPRGGGEASAGSGCRRRRPCGRCRSGNEMQRHGRRDGEDSEPARDEHGF